MRTGQLLVLGVGLVLATAALRAAPDGLGIVLALMMVAPADVEDSIIRLAQKAIEIDPWFGKANPYDMQLTSTL